MAKKAPRTDGIRNRVVKRRRMKASTLLANDHNWRGHPSTQSEALQGVLTEVGQVGKLYAYHSKRNGGALTLIDGHLRATMDPAQEWDVAITDLDDAEADKILLTRDPIAGMAEADSEKLNALLREVRTGSDGLEAMLAGLREKHPEPIAPGAGGDDFDTTPETGPTRTNVGELWLIGGKHRLFVGDCTVKENVERLMGGEKVEAVITDPPYGINHDTDYTRFSGGVHNSWNYGPRIQNDDKPFDPEPWIQYPAVALWGFNCFSDKLPLGTLLVWCKRRDSQLGSFMSDCEVAWMKTGHGVYLMNHVWNGHDRETERGEVLHPTQKPVAVMQWCIEKAKVEGVILDPFLGSGTTLIAAHRLGRCCYGCEIEPKYADVCLKRAEADNLSVERVDKQ